MTQGSKILLDAEGSRVMLIDQWLAPEAASAAFAELAAGVPWTRHEVRLFGRLLPAPRLSSWHGDPTAHYTYSGIRYPPQPWTALLSQLRQRIEQCLQQIFNSVLLNWYRDGGERMGWHADDEPELGPEPLIASLSLGASRDFLLKPRNPRDQRRLQVVLSHGSLLVMSGRTQHDWLHSLPMRKRVAAGRINLTWRQIFPHPRHT